MIEFDESGLEPRVEKVDGNYVIVVDSYVDESVDIIDKLFLLDRSIVTVYDGYEIAVMVNFIIQSNGSVITVGVEIIDEEAFLTEIAEATE